MKTKILNIAAIFFLGTTLAACEKETPPAPANPCVNGSPYNAQNPIDLANTSNALLVALGRSGGVGTCFVKYIGKQGYVSYAIYDHCTKGETFVENEDQAGEIVRARVMTGKCY